MLALLLGLRHASEPDHIAAVSTIVAGARDARRAATIGAFWGLGHTLALLLAGGLVLVLRQQLTPRSAELFELGVAAMLLVLGLRSLERAARLGRSGTRVVHAHAGVPHVHAGPHDHVHVASLTLAREPLMVGLVHGLAGSGALTTLALANMPRVNDGSGVPSVASGLAYLAIFGFGSMLGMALLSGLMGLPLGRWARALRVRAALLALAGTMSITLGFAWGWPLIVHLSAH